MCVALHRFVTHVRVRIARVEATIRRCLCVCVCVCVCLIEREGEKEREPPRRRHVPRHLGLRAQQRMAPTAHSIAPACCSLSHFTLPTLKVQSIHLASTHFIQMSRAFSTELSVRGFFQHRHIDFLRQHGHHFCLKGSDK